MNKLKTGDLILFTNEYKGVRKIFNCFNKSIEYTHVGIVLKDPTFISHNLKGLYIWHADLDENKEDIDIEDQQIKFGVKINPLIEECLNKNTKIFVRKIICNNNEIFNEKKLKEINNTINNNPYDVIPPEWLGNMFEIDNENILTHFWSSALIGYIYIKCCIIDPNTDWGSLKPSDFSLEGKNLKYVNEYIKLDNIQKLFKIDKSILIINMFKQKLKYFYNFCKKIFKKR